MKFMITLAALCLIPSASIADILKIDRSAVPVGRAVYQLVQDDIVKGQMVFESRFEESRYIIHEATAMQPDIKESATIILNGESFFPEKIILDADFSGNILDADLEFADGRVKGEYRTKKPRAIERNTIDFDSAAPFGAYSRASLFGLAAALPLNEGEKYSVSWFQSLSGAFQDISIEVEGEENLRVPAGDFETIAVRFKNATPENVLFISKTERSVVRIDIPTMNMRFELMPE